MRVKLRNKNTGEVKDLKVGWSWTCFLFSSFFGLPLFIRKLYVWGAIMLGLSVLNTISGSLASEMPAIAVINYSVGMGLFVLAIFLGRKANELTAKNMLENGWEFADEEDPATRLARKEWLLL